MPNFYPNKFQLGNLAVSPPLLLAPMAGLTHSALRTILMELGGVGLLATEMLSAKRLPSESIQVPSPVMITSPIEQPLSYQIFVNEPIFIPPAIRALEKFKPAVIDINLGCPAPKIRRFGAGSKLSEDWRKVAAVIKAARQSTSLPLSAKIRLGTELNADKLKNFTLMLQGEGVDMVTVHGRLHREPFARKPKWSWIGKVKKWLDIPVIANGGIFSVADAKKCLDISGADGLMIGRAAPTTPWLFRDIAREIYDIPSPYELDIPAVYFRFVELLIARFPERRRLGRLKEFSHYYSKNYSFGHHFAMAVQRSQSVGEVLATARDFFAKQQTQEAQDF